MVKSGMHAAFTMVSLGYLEATLSWAVCTHMAYHQCMHYGGGCEGAVGEECRDPPSYFEVGKNTKRNVLEVNWMVIGGYLHV